ncbi:hypothetical protein [Nocardia goodfellowii]|uniref:Ig-like domain-containing protein n=1 Tax=Nocardia goodfellowii TaxID=882446 RepID=A0ABS4QFJ7_9NOCA|nr:hypothetical protein [Nocardia goodfellowii]MBP2190455.1 hypothetical protein [Nocardia goodfellowii]
MIRIPRFTGIAAATIGLTIALGNPGIAQAGDFGLDGVAPAWLNCSLVWHDQNTAGIRCDGGSFLPTAHCANGQLLSGAPAAAGATSYVYCTSVNSMLRQPVLWDAIPAVA